MKKIFLTILLLANVVEAQVKTKMSVKDFFAGLNKNTMHLVDEFYAQEINFEDPIGSLQGRQNMKAYYEKLYREVKSIKFDFSKEFWNGNDYVGLWVMTLETPNLNSGKPVVVTGNSHITFDQNGQAIYHRDYFDMGAFIYEQIPILKNIILVVKGRLKHN